MIAAKAIIRDSRAFVFKLDEIDGPTVSNLFSVNSKVVAVSSLSTSV